MLKPHTNAGPRIGLLRSSFNGFNTANRQTRTQCGATRAWRAWHSRSVGCQSQTRTREMRTIQAEAARSRRTHPHGCRRNPNSGARRPFHLPPYRLPDGSFHTSERAQRGPRRFQPREEAVLNHAAAAHPRQDERHWSYTCVKRKEVAHERRGATLKGNRLAKLPA
eukprot:scaffold305249_cov36-Tisochrysis_lutea.AAC.3